MGNFSRPPYGILEINIFKAIRNILGKFIATEEKWEEKIDCRCVRILVDMDMRDGMYEELKIVMHVSAWWQLLDY